MTFKENHTAIYDIQIIAEQLHKLNERMHSAGLYFKADVADSVGLTSYKEVPENTLIVLASFDFSYYHDIEFAFHEMLAHDLPDNDAWPDHWEKEQLRVLENEERKSALQVLKCEDAADTFVFAFRCGSFTDIDYLIAAKGISIFIGTVFYYDRLKTDTLEVGQRVGWWLVDD